MSKELCVCGHGKGIHVNDFDNTRCCACWKSRTTGDTIICDCMKFELQIPTEKGEK
jgi:hypothetical protein